MAVLICIPTNSVRGFAFSTLSVAFIACRLLDSSHSNWREMVPHCGFDLHLSDNEWSTGEGNGKPLQYSCLENPMNIMKRQNDRILKEELPRSVSAQYATGAEAGRA